jgi:hypothetical protein
VNAVELYLYPKIIERDSVQISVPLKIEGESNQDNVDTVEKNIILHSKKNIVLWNAKKKTKSQLKSVFIVEKSFKPTIRISSIVLLNAEILLRVEV